MARYIHKTQVISALIAHIQGHAWSYLNLTQLVDTFKESFISRLILLLVYMISIFNLTLEGLNPKILILLILRDIVLDLTIFLLNNAHKELLLV